MIGDSIWAGLFGGLGLFLLGAYRIRSGMVGVGERLTARLGERGRSPLGALATGWMLGAMLLGSDELPRAVGRMGRSRGLGSDRATLLAIGASCGPLLASALAVAVALGWALPAAAVFALLASAVLVILGRRSERWIDALAGWGLVILGVVAMGSGWEALQQDVGRTFAADGWAGLAAPILVGALAGSLLRSPTALACVAVQATSVGLLGLQPGLALLAGVLISTSAGFVWPLRSGSGSERATAAGHVVFAALWGGLPVVFLVGFSSIAGYLTDVPGAPGTSMVLVVALAGAVAAPLAHALHTPLENLVHARPGELSERDPELLWHDLPGMLSSELHRVLQHAADSVRDMARASLGPGTVSKRAERTQAELEGIVGAIDDLRAKRTYERVPLYLGCDVLAARGCAEALRIVAVHLDHHEPTGSFGESGLDLPLTKLRIATLHLIETSRPGEPSFSPGDWDRRVIELGTSAEDLWDRAASASATGLLPPTYLSRLKVELDMLGSVVRHVDRAVSEWAALVPGLAWDVPEASAEEEPEPVPQPEPASLVRRRAARRQPVA